MGDPIRKKTICLDFDGVLHGYSRGWHDGTIYDPPIAGAPAAVQLLAEKYQLVISTCRADIPAIWTWLDFYGMAHFITDVTNAKPIAHLYVDDRGLRFEGRWDTSMVAIRELDI